MKRILIKIFPRGSFGFKVLKRIAIYLNLTPALPVHEIQFNDWANRVEPLNWTKHKKLSFEPLISIVVPVFNPPAKHFLPMVYSVVNQTYENWELILVNASSDAASRNMTKEAEAIDIRIKAVDIPRNMGIAVNTNEGLKQTSGEYVGLLDHDDCLAPQALYEVVCVLQGKNKPHLIYSDEDKLTNNGDYRVDPHFKPDWSPQLLRELNYINHFAVIDRDVFNKVGLYRTGFDGAQDYDLFLRIVDETDRIIHIPKILYHWRITSTSTSENFSQKKNILDAGVQALTDHLKRNDLHAGVSSIVNQPGFYRVDYEIKAKTKVTIVILPSPLLSEYRKFLFNFLDFVEKTNQEVEVIVQKPKVLLKDIYKSIKIHYVDESNKNNFARKASGLIETDLTLVVGSAVFPHNKTWLSGLTGLLSQNKNIVAAAPLIIAADRKTVVDAGYAKDGDRLIPLFQGYPIKQHTLFGNANWARNVDVLSEHCFMTRTDELKEHLKAVGPGDKKLFNPGFFEVLRHRNMQVVTWPFSKVVYAGEMNPPTVKTNYFSPNLDITKTEFNAAEVIQVARNFKDE